MKKSPSFAWCFFFFFFLGGGGGWCSIVDMLQSWIFELLYGRLPSRWRDTRYAPMFQDASMHASISLIMNFNILSTECHTTLLEIKYIFIRPFIYQSIYLVVAELPFRINRLCYSLITMALISILDYTLLIIYHK